MGSPSIKEFNGVYLQVKASIDVLENDPDLLASNLLSYYLRNVQYYIVQLWIYQENSIYVRDGFIFI